MKRVHEMNTRGPAAFVARPVLQPARLSTARRLAGPCGAVLGLILCVAAASADAQTQWKWRGANGKVQYSDRPPPAEVAEKDIIARPAGAVRVEVQDIPAASHGGSAASPGVRASDPQLEAKRREAELAEKAKQKVDEERLQKQRAENCDRARSYSKSLQEGLRIARTNDKGDSEILSDSQRAQEMARTQQMITSDCK